ncbi:MAG TPA: acyl-CoA dehydrogenase family protein [Jatrophihabitans sp.]|jgi:alkylation response protein AidB-like acyl-CoA dehydrogenase
MHLNLTAPERQFRDELRGWLGREVAQLPPPPPENDWIARRAYDTRWQRKLHDAGYAGLDWPVEYGGRGSTPTEHLIFLQELAQAHAPDVGVNFVGLLHAGPTLIAEGSVEQRETHLPRILCGDEVWCQGFSEPDAGSDLASLRTYAQRDGDSYVVSGRKIWTSRAEAAEYCELLVRTDRDAPKHRGISWLIMPMDSPGIEIRPLKTLLGVTDFAELVLEDVRIPVENVVGAENDGWRVAMVTFSFERGTAFVGELLQTMEIATELYSVLGSPGPAATVMRHELAEVTAELDGLWALTKRNVAQAGRGQIPVAGGSAFKLAYSSTVQKLGELAVTILGPAALSTEDVGGLPSGRQMQHSLHALGISIGGGTTQIQRNILAEKVLGLPKG